MNKLDLSIFFLILGLISSASLSAQTQNPAIKAGNVLVMGAMRNVMWKGELFGKMNLDTISNREGI
jgi:acetolactate decarboxylase